MSKFLKDSTYNSLKSKADAFDKVMGTVDGMEENMTEEEQADAIIAALENSTETETDTDSASQIESLTTQLEEANTKLATTEKEKTAAEELAASLQTELDNLPGESPASISGKSDSKEPKLSIAEFADKNADNHEAIIEQMKAEGII